MHALTLVPKKKLIREKHHSKAKNETITLEIWELHIIKRGLCVCVFVCVFVCLFVYELLLNGWTDRHETLKVCRGGSREGFKTGLRRRRRLPRAVGAKMRPQAAFFHNLEPYARQRRARAAEGPPAK